MGVDKNLETTDDGNVGGVDSIRQGVGVAVSAQEGGKDLSDAAERMLKLTLTVTEECNSQGNYVGLSKAQREKLGVNVGDVVTLRGADGKVFGQRTVGLGKNSLAGRPGEFSANGVQIGESVTVVKGVVENALNNLSVSKGVESGEKHGRRSGIINERFGKKGFNGEVYVVLPDAVVRQISTQVPRSGDGKPNVSSIALGSVKIGETVRELPVVPAGSEMGLTSESAKMLGVPDGLKSCEFYVKDGVLVVNGFE